MKKTYNDWLKNIVNDDFDILEDIIKSKYKKFKSIYRLISDESDNIHSMSYEFTDEDNMILCIRLTEDDYKQDFIDNINSKNAIYDMDTIEDGNIIRMNIQLHED